MESPLVSTQGMKRLHKHLSYFCQPLLTLKNHRPQRDGNGQRKDGADRLRSASSDKSSCGWWVMFGFLATSRGFGLCCTNTLDVWGATGCFKRLSLTRTREMVSKTRKYTLTSVVCTCVTRVYNKNNNLNLTTDACSVLLSEKIQTFRHNVSVKLVSGGYIWQTSLLSVRLMINNKLMRE